MKSNGNHLTTTAESFPPSDQSFVKQVPGGDGSINNNDTPNGAGMGAGTGGPLSDDVVVDKYAPGPDASCNERFFTPKVILALWTMMNFWTYFDRGAVASCLSNIRSDPVIDGTGGVISDAQGGAIVSAFMVGFFLTCPIFAALGGTFTAKQIICAGLIVWALACVSTGLSQDYWMIVISRCFVGVGEAAYAGYTVTIIDNIAPKAKRTMWIGTYYSMIPVGTAVGMAASGVMAKLINFDGIAGWRVVFVVEVIPMIPIIISNMILPKKYNPVKEKGTGAAGDEFVSLPHALKGLATNLNYILLVFGYAMYTFVLGAIAVWAISMLEQGPLHLTTIESSLLMGGAVAITGLLGSVMGGLFVDKMGGSQGTRGILQCAKYNVLMMCISLPLGAGALFSSSLPVFATLFVLGVFLLFSVTAPVNASLLSSVPPEFRTYSIAFSVFFMHMLGDFPSPIVAGKLSDGFSDGCDQLSPPHGTNVTCELHPNCRYIPAEGIENPSCVNIYQLRNALLIVWAFIGLAIPAWGIVGLRARSKLKEEEENGTGPGGLTASLLAKHSGSGVNSRTALNDPATQSQLSMRSAYEATA
jgi:MFS family permease